MTFMLLAPRDPDHTGRETERECGRQGSGVPQARAWHEERSLGYTSAGLSWQGVHTCGTKAN